MLVIKLSVVTVLLLLLSGNFGSLENYLSNKYHTATAQYLNLKLTQIAVEGRDKVTDAEIQNILRPYMGDSILRADIYKLKHEFEKLDWVRACSVERRFPDTLYISFVEKEAMAIWQYKGRLYIIDYFGEVITDIDAQNYQNLPILVGPDAKIHAAELLNSLQRFPALYKDFRAGIRYGERRWNIRLYNDLEIKLPETDIEPALSYVENLLQKKHLYNNAIESLDLRDPKRYYIKRTPNLR
jgi:cell division protein FtsQ